MILYGNNRVLQKNYRRIFEIVNPIISLQKKGKKFVWDKKCKEIFNKLKGLLTTAPILKIADRDKYLCHMH